MAFKLDNLLKPSESVAAAIAASGLVLGTYNSALPSMTEIHGAQANNNSVENSRKKALYTSAGIVATLFLITHDSNVFIIGGATIVAIDWQARHANAVHPKTGRVVPTANANAANLEQGYTDAPMEQGDEYQG